MTSPSYAEIALTVGAVWTAIKWWIDRKDARSALAAAKADADKTVTALTATVHTKDAELVAIREDRDYWQRRAYHAEDALPRHSAEPA
jgi:hypothetical protein